MNQYSIFLSNHPFLVTTIVIFLMLLFARSFCLLIKMSKTYSSHVMRLEGMMHSQSIADNGLYLRCLAQDYARELINRDCRGYRNNFRKLLHDWEDIKTQNIDYKIEMLDKLNNINPYYEDFGRLGYRGRIHIADSDAFYDCSDKDLWEAYKSIRLHQALSIEVDTSGLHVNSHKYNDTRISITNDELDHLVIYTDVLIELQLLACLKEAHGLLEDLKQLNTPFKRYESVPMLTNQGYSITFLGMVPFGGKYGVFVKDLDMYGYWETCAPEDKKYTTYFIANNDQFSEGRKLDECALYHIEDVGAQV